MKTLKKALATGLLAVAAVWSPPTIAQDDGTEKEQKDEVKEKEKKIDSVSDRYRDKKRRGGFIFSPGLYRATDPKINGSEISLLFNGYGPAIGFEKGKFKYAEIEIASIFFSLGAGIRKTEKINPEDKGDDASQVTFALPVFFLFPYIRWIFDDPHREREVGVMLKFPLSFGGSKHHDDD